MNNTIFVGLDVHKETIAVAYAKADEGWKFSEWQGDAEGTEEVILVEMDGDKDITVVFEREEYSLNIEISREKGK